MSPAAAATKGRIKFEDPPINELVIALYHLPILELKAQHIGIYWEGIRDKYPLCEQQFPVITASGVPDTAPGEVFPLPRFWFSSNEHRLLLQIQRNAFMFNWRRGAAEEYPHYEAVAADFWKELETYKAFLHAVGAKLDVIQRCELTYVNLIVQNEVFKSLDDFANVLPLVASLADAQTEDRKLTGMLATITYRVSPTTLIDLSVRSGTRMESKEVASVLELKAHGAPADLSLDGARAWYDAAHDATYSLFLDSTDKQVQKNIWKPR